MYSEYKKRLYIIWLFLGILGALLLIKLFYIQVLKNRELKKKAEDIHIKERVYTLPRGTIFDRNGNILAMSADTVSILVHPKEISTKDYFRVLKVLGIKQLNLNKNGKSFWLKRRLPIEKAEKIREKIKKIKGIEFLIEHKRYYPYNTIGGNLLGFVKFEDDARKIIGMSGIELGFNKYLLGSSHNPKIMRDGQGRILYTKERFPEELKGGDIYLAIDVRLQYIAEEELKKSCQEYEAKGGVCIIGNPKTGEILAQSTIPSFDPNAYSVWEKEMWKKIPKETRKNKAVSFVFEPGSLFKPIIAGILLEEGLVKEDDRFFCSGEYKVGNRKICCPHKHGAQSFRDVLKNSCNVGMSQAIENLKDERLLFYLSQFGFGTKTNTGIIEEEVGIFSKKMTKIRKANLSFGYGISVTPIQLWLAVSSFCNNGILFSPIVVRSILLNNKIIKEEKPTPKREVLSQDTINKLKDMMVSIVDEGTGINAKIEGYKIAGKTGTAEKAIGGRYNSSKIVSSFIGFFPADNPEILILVILDEPKKAHYASIVAAPCFKRIAERVIFLEKIKKGL
ncbi:MAG: penicillin-binding protein 2 [bacterium]